VHLVGGIELDVARRAFEIHAEAPPVVDNNKSGPPAIPSISPRRR